jgi:hypothetical protein
LLLNLLNILHNCVHCGYLYTFKFFQRWDVLIEEDQDLRNWHIGRVRHTFKELQH